jgi:hypothetical protein
MKASRTGSSSCMISILWSCRPRTWTIIPGVPYSKPWRVSPKAGPDARDEE